MTYSHIIQTGYPVDIPKPGQTVTLMLDPQRTPLLVLRVEPMLACQKPDGSEVIVPAHMVEVVGDAEIREVQP